MASNRKQLREFLAAHPEYEGYVKYISRFWSTAKILKHIKDKGVQQNADDESLRQGRQACGFVSAAHEESIVQRTSDEEHND